MHPTFFKILAPILFLEWIKLDTSSLVCMWTVASTNQRKINWPLRGRGQGHMTNL